MNEITEFTYQGIRLKYNPETGECWRKLRVSGDWRLITAGTRNGKYTCLNTGTRMEQLHRIIAEVFLNGGKPLTATQQVDHIKHADGSHAQDSLSNLRIASHGQNIMNRGCLSTNTSGYKGVSLRKPTGKWRAEITSCGRHKCLGYFPTAEAAAKVYDLAAKELHGEFAKLNFN